MSIFEDFLKKEEKSKETTKSKKQLHTIEEKPQEFKTKTKTIEKQDININQIFRELALTSEFKRLIYKAIVGKVHRGSKEDLDKKLSKVLEEVRK